MKFCGYVRVSRVGGREGDGYISPSVQREAIAAYAGELGGEIIEWFTDEDYSGGNTDRPGFQAALEMIRAGGSDGIVVMKVDRFARSVADGASIAREIVDNGKVFASCQERIDPRTPEGKYMLTSFLANGELFLDQSKAAWKTAKGRAIGRGATMGPTPFGYLRVKFPATKRNHISPADAAALVGHEPQAGTLIPDPVTGPLVTEMFRKAAGGSSPAEIASWLEREHPATDRRPWGANDIRRWLAKRVYLGEVYYGTLSSTGTHEPLTDPATFTAATPDPTKPRRRGSTRPLVGLVRCANCDGMMVGNSFGGADHDTPVYRCGQACGNGSVITARRLEGYVFDVCRAVLKNRKLNDVPADTGDIDARIRAAEAELDAFVSNLTIRAAIGEAKWEAGVQLRADAVSRLTDERAAAIRSNTLFAIDVDNPSEHDLRSFAFATIEKVIVRRGRQPAVERITIVRQRPFKASS